MQLPVIEVESRLMRRYTYYIVLVIPLMFVTMAEDIQNGREELLEAAMDYLINH
jgi:hypothetical protein